jgi:multicomponent Na+:H+ antiporter subunit E
MNARSVTLSLLLFVFWLALSGHYTTFLVACGAIASVVIVMLTVRKQTLDEEAVPVEAMRGAIEYWPWLWLEILKSSWAVARLILGPRMAISPTMTEVDSALRTPVGLATYANSITLTPGTVTCKLSGHRLTVYALTREGALDVESGAMEMHARVMEGKT